MQIINIDSYPFGKALPHWAVLFLVGVTYIHTIPTYDDYVHTSVITQITVIGAVLSLISEIWSY